MGVSGKGCGTRDVAMADGVQRVATFAEDPAGAGEAFAQRENIGGDVLLGARNAFLRGGELVHEGEAEVVLAGAEVDAGETPAESAGSLPTDLAAKTGGISSGLDRAEIAQESEEDSLKELPVLGATGEKGAQPKVIAFFLIDVDGGEVALAAGGDIEAEPEGAMFAWTRRVAAVVFLRRRYKKRTKTGNDEVVDFGLAIDEAIGIDLANAPQAAEVKFEGGINGSGKRAVRFLVNLALSARSVLVSRFVAAGYFSQKRDWSGNPSAGKT